MSVLLIVTTLPHCLRRYGVFNVARGKRLWTNCPVSECQETLDLIGPILLCGQIYYICLAKIHTHTHIKRKTQVISYMNIGSG